MQNLEIDWKIVFTVITVIISLISLFVSLKACSLSQKADSRSERLYQSQKMSAIQVNPISFEEYEYDGQKMGRLMLQIVNYTAFDAVDLKIDAKFEDTWITEWMIAAVKGLSEQEKKGTLSEKMSSELNVYRLSLSKKKFDLAPNGISPTLIFQGSLNFDRNKQKLILVRARWISENGAIFDKYFKYELISTQAFGAESLTLIPLE